MLDGVGYSGEVWISETGYRAPPGDMAEEALQAIYVERVLEEQLQRAWYTNTFFYEINDCGIDQPSCTIDGFGLMRPTAGQPGTRSFPADFRRKPAFDALADFIANNPAVVGAQPPAQCGDGVDNDGDGRIDLQDRGCSGPGDDDESDDPPRVELIATPGRATLDGEFSDFPGPFLALPPEAWQGTEPLGPNDLEVQVAALWSTDGLSLAFEVTDDQHNNDRPPDLLWQADSVQLAFDVGQSGGAGYDPLDDHELNFALSGGAVSTFRFHGPARRRGTI